MPLSLPSHPDLGQLKRQAKELRDNYLAGVPAAIALVNEHFTAASPTDFPLHRAQLVLARAHGFDSWPKLKAHIDGVTIARLMAAVRAGNSGDVEALLRARPELVNREEPGSHGYMPLHHAVLQRRPDLVRLLMRHGADPHTTTAGIHALRHAATPLALATDRQFTEIVAIIQEEEQRRANRHTPAAGAPAQLRAAVESGDEALALSLLEQHPDLASLAFSNQRLTLLHLASGLLWPRAAARLLAAGADPNQPDNTGRTPLDLAGFRCHPVHSAEERTNMARLLLHHGASLTPRGAILLGDLPSLQHFASTQNLIPPRDEDGWLLRTAVDCGEPAILEFLLALGLDPDARIRVTGDEENVFTWGMPLYQCTRYGRYAMAETLLKHGADANGEVYASGTPLSEAYGQRDEQMVALLERYGGKTEPWMVGLYRRPDVARQLLADADGESKPALAEALLGGAARGGDWETFRLALPHVQIPNGDPRWNGLLQAPLGFWNHWVGPWCHLEWDRTTYLSCFRAILERSGPPNAPLNCGATVLHQIVAMGSHVTAAERIEFANAALHAGARLDLRDDLLQSTPLAWAARWGRQELVELFLRHGASPVEPTAEPWAAPLACAEKEGHAGIASLLRAHMSTPPDQMKD